MSDSHRHIPPLARRVEALEENTRSARQDISRLEKAVDDLTPPPSHSHDIVVPPPTVSMDDYITDIEEHKAKIAELKEKIADRDVGVKKLEDLLAQIRKSRDEKSEEIHRLQTEIGFWKRNDKELDRLREKAEAQYLVIENQRDEKEELEADRDNWVRVADGRLEEIKALERRIRVLRDI